jgi:hypothetical protein
MMKTVCSILLIILPTQVKSQISNPAARQELKPIVKQGTRYYYDGKKLHNGYSIQVPLEMLNDEAINRSFKKYQNMRRIGRYSYFVPLVYLVAISYPPANSGGSTINQTQANTGSALLWGAFFSNMGCNYFSNSYLRSGVDRYNQLVLKKNTFGFKVDALPGNYQQVGLAYLHRIE